MTTQTITIQVDLTTAKVLQALMTKAETQGKTTAGLFEELKETGEPLVLRVNGDEMVVVQAADGYRRLLEALDRAEAIEGIQRGLESMKQGRGRPAREVLEEIRDEAVHVLHIRHSSQRPLTPDDE